MENKSMSVDEFAYDMGLTVLMAREAIKEGKFEYFAWAIGMKEGKARTKIYINRGRYELWKKGHDLELIKKALQEAGTSQSANN